MNSCWLFGHKWVFHKEWKVEHPMYGIDTSDPRYARVYAETRYNIFRCKYCGQNAKTDKRIAVDNSRREKWERRSELLKDIFK